MRFWKKQTDSDVIERTEEHPDEKKQHLRKSTHQS